MTDFCTEILVTENKYIKKLYVYKTEEIEIKLPRTSPPINKQAKIVYVCIYIYVLENHSNDFHKIWYYMSFWAREDDLDRSQPCKKIGLSICLTVNTTHINLENRSNDFHKISFFIYFGPEKTI